MIDARAAARALRGSVVGRNRLLCPGPGHSARDRSVSVLLDPGAPDGFVVNTFAGDDWQACRDHVRAALGIEREVRRRKRRPHRRPAPSPRPAAVPAALAPRWASWWERECKPITPDCVAGRYLASRGCALPPGDGDVRWHPRVLHAPSRRCWPAMVARVTAAATGDAVSLHFTYVAVDGAGKAGVEPQRLYLAGHRLPPGSVVRVWPDDVVTTGLLVAEGVESTLAAARGFSPAWACMDAGHLAAFPPLAGIEALTIASDRDDAGQRAAESCAAAWRAAGREVRIWRAPAGAPKGADFDDFARGAP